MLANIELFFSAHFEIIEKITALVIFLIVLIPAIKKDQIKLKEKWRKEWEAEQQENQDFRQASKPLTQQSFEKWKAEKQKREP